MSESIEFAMEEVGRLEKFLSPIGIKAQLIVFKVTNPVFSIKQALATIEEEIDLLISMKRMKYSGKVQSAILLSIN